jgi:RES domain-containing protein
VPDAVDPAGEWLRHVPHGADARSRPQPPADNRWQRGSVVDALYLADSEETLWAEWYRHLAERGIPPLRPLPRDLWRFQVRSLRIADLSDEERLAAVGLLPPAPGRGNWPHYQEAGERLWREGWQGLLAPSAARPRGVILCLFIDDPTTLPADPVASPATVSAPPPPPTGMQT